MLPLEHSAKLLTCIKRVLVLKTYFCLFEWPLKTGLTVYILILFLSEKEMGLYRVWKGIWVSGYGSRDMGLGILLACPYPF